MEHPDLLGIIPTVHWSVQERARALGLDKDDFRWEARLGHSIAPGIWDGTATQSRLELIARIATALRVNPPPLWRWSEDGHSLVWQVRELAEAQGLDKARLARLANIGITNLGSKTNSPIDRIWDGESQGVLLVTVARLCRVLGLDPGPLFAWGPDVAQDAYEQGATAPGLRDYFGARDEESVKRRQKRRSSRAQKIDKASTP